MEELEKFSLMAKILKQQSPFFIFYYPVTENIHTNN